MLSNLEESKESEKLISSVIVRKCSYSECEKAESYNGRKWKENWYNYNNGFLCLKHYCKLVRDPLRPKEYNKKYNDRVTAEKLKEYRSRVTPEQRKRWNKISYQKTGHNRVRFKLQQINLKHNPRTGQCQLCNKKIGDEYINWYGKVAIVKKIDIHHIEYHDDDPLKDIIELCMSCHSKETWKLKKLKSN